MPVTSRPVLSQDIHSYMRDNNRTRKRHARYCQLYLGGQLLGGWQMFNNAEANGVHLEPEGGSDFQEVVVGARQFTITLRRQMQRGSDLPEMVRNEYPGVQDVDFRDLPFVMRYHYLYQAIMDPKGGYQTREDATWHYSDCGISNYSWGGESPTGLLTESMTAISRGYAFGDDGKQGRNVPKGLLGN